MDGLTADEFPAFFQAVHGVSPFPWQERLLRAVAGSNSWPSVLDLPTGSGKTAALDIAVFHLAMEADKGEERRAPVRIAFVVDRRLIVDDAYVRAKRIETILAEAANNASSPKILRKIATQLSHLAEREDRPLLARRLRGGAPREDDWVRTPSQPTILCSTVDQVGSRLLFRGYGISDRMKTLHAGLLGSDCLILLDEAHLAEPFRQTVTSITKLRGQNTVMAPWHVALLSATPGNQLQAVFRLNNDDRAHPVLARRLTASKPATLIEIAGRQGVPVEVRRIEEIVNQVRKTLEVLRRDLPNPAIGVVVNRVIRARQAFDQLKSELPDTKVILIIGPARSVDREELVKRDLQPIRTGQKRGLEKPLIIVATQTVEAGVDIDFDGLVTEAAALDSLRQRFGRLNRAGRDIAPVAMILAHKDDLATRADDPVYGDRIGKTWDALSEVAAISPERVVEFGIAGFPGRLAEDSDNLASEKQDAPILLPAYADLWSQTSPIPRADPEVALFLHGGDRSPASVQLIWRADIAEGDLDERNRYDVAALLDLVPPRTGEAIEIPLWAARAWLQADNAAQVALADIAERPPEEIGGRGRRRVFRYAGSDDERRTSAVVADELRNGDLIVVPASYGGCDPWGWAPSSTEAVMDLAEQAASPYAARRFSVRATPELIRQWLIHEQRDSDQQGIASLDVVRRKLCATLAEHRDETASKLLDTVLGLQSLPAAMRRLLKLLKNQGRLEHAFPYGYDIEDRPRGVVFLAPRGIKGEHSEAEYEGSIPATEDDRLGSTPGYAQTLNDHSCMVRNRAAEFSGKAGLRQDLADDVALAAYLHDAGKADPRFQMMLYGGDWLAVDEMRILAKSEKRASPADWTKAGLPEKWRHEALSVRIAREHALLKQAHDPELILWLIGVHHGYGRPLFPHADAWDERDRYDLVNIDGSAATLRRGAGPQSLAFSFNGRDWPQIFEHLKRRYGIWELSRLEAIVRLADHRASEEAGDRAADEGRS